MASASFSSTRTDACRGGERDFTTWADLHQRDHRRQQASLAQITAHPDVDAAADATHQLQAWAEHHAHDRRLHDSAIAQIRRR